jgi:hypothetical protein
MPFRTGIARSITIRSGRSFAAFSISSLLEMQNESTRLVWGPGGLSQSEAGASNGSDEFCHGGFEKIEEYRILPDSPFARLHGKVADLSVRTISERVSLTQLNRVVS